jgi:tRNA/rRNA methyltransferase
VSADIVSDLRIVLVRPKSSANVGAAARAMKNFGLADLVLVAPRCRLDQQAYALASHAGDVLEGARVVATVPEAIADRSRVLGTTARGRASESFTAYEPDEGLATLPQRGGALLFGPEDHGLSTDDLAHCQGHICIPTAAYASINLAQAVNILAYAYYRLRHDTPPAPETERAPREQFEPMYRQLLELLRLIGYTDEARAASIERLYRGILDRAELSPRELAALRGLWQQAAWAAEQPPERLPSRRERR